MSNNQICKLIGIVGITISWLSMGLMFFGEMWAVYPAVVGFILSWFAYKNFD